MHEFDLIQRYFTWDDSLADYSSHSASGVSLGVGDDAAILNIPANKQLVTSVDTLISGVHFPETTSAKAIAHKALAVNLSDLAAMGASPAWFTLALTIPEINETWLEDFSQGLHSLAKQYGIALVGGDTTRGPLSITIQVMGLVERDKALLRSGAKLGDKIYVSGCLGDAAVALQTIIGDLNLPDDQQKILQKALDYPEPRLLESAIIKDYASACIDLSDGLLQDLSHMIKQSRVGAVLDLTQIPLSSTLLALGLDQSEKLKFALSGGDDYELLFCVPEDKEAAFLNTIQSHKKLINVSCIGKISAQQGMIVDQNQTVLVDLSSSSSSAVSGYNHFSQTNVNNHE